MLPRESERNARAVAPTDESGARDAECIHDRDDIAGHALVAVRPVVARAAPMATGVDHDGAEAGGGQGGNLVGQIPGMAETAVEEDNRLSPRRAVGRGPDAGAVVLHAPLGTAGREGEAVGGEVG